MPTANPHYRVFEVTEEDIDYAIARSSEFCPIGEVIARTVPNASHVIVDLATIRWSDPIKRKRYIYLTPPNAQQFIVDFDRADKDHVQPFTFKLFAPVQITDMRTRSNRSRDRAEEYQRAKTKASVVINSKGPPTKVGGHRIPTKGNIQRVRLYGARTLKR